MKLNAFLSSNSKYKRLVEIICVCFIYSGIVFVANWSILLGNNLMKWDIWNAHYPMNALVSDAIKEGSFPLWNPLYNYGTPYYAMVGTPVWYPVTLVFNIIGYNPITPAWEYCFHIVLGSIGMYLLVFYELGLIKEKSKAYIGKISFLSGIVFGFSGMYLSNAQHIMIIISIAWIPFVLLFSKKYILTDNRRYLFLLAISISMILLGGYPELLYDTVLILFVWIFVSTKGDVGKRLIMTIKRYVIIGILSFMASAISLIPFLNIKALLSRGEGVFVTSSDFSAVLSLMFPTVEERLLGHEISMESFYICLVIIIPFVFCKKILQIRRDSVIKYITISFVSVILAFGANSFLHTLFYRFFPMYSTFRFASMWRAFFIIFLILASSIMWFDIFENGYEFSKKRFLSAVTIIATISVVMFVASAILPNEEQKTNMELVTKSFLSLLFFMICYILVLNNIKTNKNVAICYLVAVVIVECLSTAHLYFPLTVAAYNKTDYITPWISENIREEISEYENRNKRCDFANNPRSYSGLMEAKQLVLDKTFDTGGYLSIKLKAVEDYKQTFNSDVIAKNPEVFFTNNISQVNNKKLEEWLNDKSIDATGIAVTEKTTLDIDEKNQVAEPVNVTHFGFNSLSFNYDAPVDGIVTILQANYSGWKLWVDGKKQNIKTIDGCFIGVELPKGEHKVELKFRPTDFYLGLVISALFYIIFAITECRYLKKKRIY